MVVEVDSDEPGVRERVCEYPQGPFITAICVNVGFLIVCSAFAFKNRTLPNNFNESKFAAFFVYSTCVMWLAFVPAYFLTRNGYKILFLCIMLIGNAVVCICGLYVPKVYAVYFVENDHLHIIGIKKLFRSASQRLTSRPSQFLNEDGDFNDSLEQGTNTTQKSGERERKIGVVSTHKPSTVSSLKVGGKSNKIAPAVAKKVVINDKNNKDSSDNKTANTEGIDNNKTNSETDSEKTTVKEKVNPESGKGKKKVVNPEGEPQSKVTPPAKASISGGSKVTESSLQKDVKTTKDAKQEDVSARPATSQGEKNKVQSPRAVTGQGRPICDQKVQPSGLAKLPGQAKPPGQAKTLGQSKSQRQSNPLVKGASSANLSKKEKPEPDVVSKVKGETVRGRSVTSPVDNTAGGGQGQKSKKVSTTAVDRRMSVQAGRSPRPSTTVRK